MELKKSGRLYAPLADKPLNGSVATLSITDWIRLLSKMVQIQDILTCIKLNNCALNAVNCDRATDPIFLSYQTTVKILDIFRL